MSMIKTVYRYRIFCNTEDEHVYTWSQEEPTVCPTNDQHSINSDTIAIVDKVKSTDVELIEEKCPIGSVPTNAHFMCETSAFNIAADSTATSTRTFPYPISGLICYWTTDSRHEGDLLSCGVYMGTVGAITSDVTADDTVINVSSTVIQYFDHGYYLILDDGTNSEEHEVISVGASTVTLAEGTTNSYAAATPTYCKLMGYKLKNYEFGPGSREVVGQGKVGGSYIPAGCEIRTTYKNNGDSQVRFVVALEFLY